MGFALTESDGAPSFGSTATSENQLDMHPRRIATWTVGALLAVSSSGAGITGPEILERVRGAYERVSTFSADFDQTFEWKLAGVVQQMHGRFEMKKPNRFRLQTEVQTVVSDGRTVWSYSPATQQVIINDYDPNTMPMRPDNFLFSFPDEQHITFLRDEQFGGADCHVVEVVPRDSTLGIETMQVWVDGRTWTARKVQYTSVGNDVTTYVLKDVRMNPRLDDSTFAFTPPPAADVVDFRAR